MSLNMKLRRASDIHFSQACALHLQHTAPKGMDCYLSFKEVYEHPQAPRSLPKGVYLYIGTFGNILTSSLLSPTSLVL